jgi:hypothetical protein
VWTGGGGKPENPRRGTYPTTIGGRETIISIEMGLRRTAEVVESSIEFFAGTGDGEEANDGMTCCARIYVHRKELHGKWAERAGITGLYTWVYTCVR